MVSTPPVLDESVTAVTDGPREQPGPEAKALLSGLTENAQLPPKVAALLCVNDQRRVNLCRTAINKFLTWQLYSNYEIIVVNSTGNKVTNRDHKLVRELEANPDKFPTFSSLRNFGIEWADSDWIFPIEDGDFHHAYKLIMQMGMRNEDACVLLSHQVHVDVVNSVICVHEDQVGIPNSILFPRTNPVGSMNLYDDALEGPQAEKDFFERNFGDNRVVMRNVDWFPGPALTVCCWHSLSAASREDFLGIYADTAKYKGMRPPGVDDLTFRYVKSTLRAYGLKFDISQAEGPASEEKEQSSQ